METKPMYFRLNNFSQWLVNTMREQDIKVDRLAKRSGVHPNTIRNYIHNKCEPTLFNATCIVNALGYDMVAMKK